MQGYFDTGMSASYAPQKVERAKEKPPPNTHIPMGICLIDSVAVELKRRKVTHLNHKEGKLSVCK